MSATAAVLATRFLHAARSARTALPMQCPQLVNTCPNTHWIEIVLVDDDDRPVAGADYKVTSPDGREHCGRLDAAGLARIDGIAAGECRVEFPGIDRHALMRV